MRPHILRTKVLLVLPNYLRGGPGRNPDGKRRDRKVKKVPDDVVNQEPLPLPTPRLEGVVTRFRLGMLKLTKPAKGFGSSKVCMVSADGSLPSS